ncbi:MAG: prepilin-type N-terminal cleavage/methylation domain-containing protein [Desulfobacterales bacterium]|nr:prepilin-type N-terminal cleavage/methylation domain-containing protein [Pseudomonadota bacterium]MBU4354879.1 prepilin-type N-terminal cleavage/methylation domain-containing protein [Pseudomonadota bacterium]MCG2773703.1 prepilin-type N-terminal cleavage/methylation domain-containing protein [Desulfobacterales bacterium]
MAQTGKSGESAGFTLLELMIALGLTALLSLVAYSALSLSLKAMRHGQAAAEQVQELRVAQTILARSLSSAVSGSLDQRRYFIGNATEMRFFTPVPLEAHNMGGIYHWRVLAGTDESNQLVLAVEQTKNVNWFRDPEGVEVRQIIMGNLTFLRFTYGQGDEEYETWDAVKARGLPHWIRVYLTQKGRAPLVWFIHLPVSDFRDDARSF